eukprot:968193_1
MFEKFCCVRNPLHLQFQMASRMWKCSKLIAQITIFVGFLTLSQAAIYTEGQTDRSGVKFPVGNLNLIERSAEFNKVKAQMYQLKLEADFEFPITTPVIADLAGGFNTPIQEDDFGPVVTALQHIIGKNSNNVPFYTVAGDLQHANSIRAADKTTGKYTTTEEHFGVYEEKFKENIEENFLDKIDVPMFAVSGNYEHDRNFLMKLPRKDNLLAKEMYSLDIVSDSGEQLALWVFLNIEYQINQNKNPEASSQFLEYLLNKTKAKYIFVVSHNPFGDKEKENHELLHIKQNVLDKFPHKTITYISGHNHVAWFSQTQNIKEGGLLNEVIASGANRMHAFHPEFQKHLIGGKFMASCVTEKDGRPIMPTMPEGSFHKMEDNGKTLAVFEYDSDKLVLKFYDAERPNSPIYRHNIVSSRTPDPSAEYHTAFCIVLILIGAVLMSVAYFCFRGTRLYFLTVPTLFGGAVTLMSGVAAYLPKKRYSTHIILLMLIALSAWFFMFLSGSFDSNVVGYPRQTFDSGRYMNSTTTDVFSNDSYHTSPNFLAYILPLLISLIVFA